MTRRAARAPSTARSPTRARDPRGIPRARAQRAHDARKALDALFDAGAPLPTPVRGFGRARAWLGSQRREVIDAAHALLRGALEVCPDLVTAPTHRHEIGACVLVRLAPFHDRALRSTRTFAPTSAVPRDRVMELVRHLFERYPTPPWLMATVLTPPSSMAVHEARDAPPARAYVHVAQGGSFVDAGLPLMVTRAMAHALSTSTVVGPRLAVRTAQVDAARVHKPLRRALAALLANLPFGTPREEALLERWIAFLAREELPANALDDVWRLVRSKMATDPGFSFSGRTAASLVELALVEVPRYQTPAALLGPLPPSGIQTGPVLSRGHEGPDDAVAAPCASYTVREFDSGLALQHEGVRMRHCVATYASRVASRACAIFTAVPDDGSGSGLTVEVALASRAIVQAKGFANRAPTGEERAILEAWARTADLRVQI